MQIKATIPESYRGTRLDKALATMFSEHSRTSIQSWLDAGRVLMNGCQPSRRMIVTGGEVIEINVPQQEPHEWIPQPIPIEVVFEDEALLVVNKPAGLVVHPGAGNPQDTLLNALLNFNSSLATLPRAGIVHRLDKNTSGLLVIAKTEASRLSLIKQFKKRAATRQYVAIVEGRLVSGGTIDIAIGRHRHDRRRMTTGVGKGAVSHYRIISRYRAHSLVRVQLETGRTHQIRVHFKHAGFPLVGDPEYGGRPRYPSGASAELIEKLGSFCRQALHAEALELDHPETGERRHWATGVPHDMRELIVTLKKDVDEAGSAK